MSFEFRKITQGSENPGTEFGKEIAKGIGVGLESSSYYAITAIENIYVELETLTKNAAKNAEKLEKKRQQRQLDNLKNSLELGLICEQEYYEKLKKFRDENLRQGSDAWYKSTEEIAAYNKKMLDEAEKQYEKILSLRDDLSKRLKGSEPWASTSKVRFVGMGENGTDLVYNETELNNFLEEIRLLENYRDRLKELQALDGVPEGVFGDIGKMDIKAGLAAVNAILLSDENVRKDFFEGYRSHENLTESVANDLVGLFNSRELAEEGIYGLDGFVGGYVSSEKNKGFIDILKASFSEVPESYFTLGEQAGDSFGNGFLGKISGIVESTKNYFAVAINEIAEKLSAVLMTAAENMTRNVNNTYQTTYTFNSSSDTTTQQLNAARNAATLNRLRGGTGS